MCSSTGLKQKMKTRRPNTAGSLFQMV